MATNRERGGTLPPGPRNTLVTTARYVRDPFSGLLAAAQRYGDPFTWPTFLGPIVVTGDPAGIKELLTADPDTYTALGAELLGPVVGANNLILLSGEAHRAMRKLYNPHFHGERLHDYGTTIARIAEEHIGSGPAIVRSRSRSSMREISLDVILEVVLGLGEPARRDAFKQAVLRSSARSSRRSCSSQPAPSLLRPRRLGPLPPARGRGRGAVRGGTVGAPRRRRAAARRPELAGRLPGWRWRGARQRGILEQMISLIGAGHETTASALTWALFHIHREASL